jgi:hypothetical protein
MFMRVTTAYGAPENLNTGVVVLRKGLRAGIKGGYVSVDRATGKVITISLWDTLEEAETVSELTPFMQRQIAGMLGVSKAPTHEIYEVAVVGRL